LVFANPSTEEPLFKFTPGRSFLRSGDDPHPFPTIGSSNPSLTMAALAFRAAESILSDLRS
jgi:hypothetical protein